MTVRCSTPGDDEQNNFYANTLKVPVLNLGKAKIHSVHESPSNRQGKSN